MSGARLNRNPRTSDGPGGITVHEGQPIMTPTGLKTPHISKELLQHLGEIFPIKASKDFALRDYDRIVGHQEVIQHLQALYAQQQTE